jgi:hypothetical protein
VRYRIVETFYWRLLDVAESCNGGEGGIRTPDSLATMSDFESGAFNRALPPLRLLISLFSVFYCLGLFG